jgi:membrane-associated phospholipid phosphatase
MKPGNPGVGLSIALSSLALALLVRRVRRRQTETFDQQVSAQVGNGQRPADVLSALAQPRTTLIEAVAIAALPKLRRRDRAMILGAPLLAGALGHVLKLLVPRDRPGRTRFSPEGSQSFPSTHAAHTAALAFALAGVGKEHGLGRWPIVAAGAITLAISYARLRAGAHWPTDVAAGSLLGFASAQITLMAARRAAD